MNAETVRNKVVFHFQDSFKSLQGGLESQDDCYCDIDAALGQIVRANFSDCEAYQHLEGLLSIGLLRLDVFNRVFLSSYHAVGTQHAD